MNDGVAAELDGMNLGDKRLNDRSRRLIETLYANPRASCNAACKGWSETTAAYRFFNNPAIEPEKILQPHIEATQLRMREHPVVLILQDTTELDYTAHPPKDARCLNRENRFGLYDHTHLAISPERLCLGVAGVEYFDRDAADLGKTKDRSGLPIEEKESMRWLAGFRLACEVSRDCPETQIVSIADREADIYDIFLEAEKQSVEQPQSADFIIRGKQPRSTPQPDPAAGKHAYKKVRDEVRQAELRAVQMLELPRTPKREARTAKLEVRAISVAVKPPHERRHLPQAALNVVLVEEVDGPSDGTDVSWLLLTSLPIDTLAEVQNVVDYYVARWTIEVFFRVFKTGCRVEEIQLETLSRLKNCLAFYKIIAWRIMYLTYLNRECPELPCNVVFDDSEWKSVWMVASGEDPPKTVPALAEFMKLLTQLGGYNNRATEPPAGPQPIWIGIRRMTDLASAWNTFGPGAT